MGHVKNKAGEERDAAAAAWARKAQNQDYCCEICGRLVDLVDREPYFREKRCGECASYASKDD